MILVLMQNAWFHQPLGHPEWSPRWRKIWLYATARCRSGQRLRKLLGEDCFENDDIWFDDASPQVAYGDSSIKFPCDFEHVKRVIANANPDVLVLCGKEAGKVATIWPGRMIEVPHPACRVLRDLAYEYGRRWLHGELPHCGPRAQLTINKDKTFTIWPHPVKCAEAP